MALYFLANERLPQFPFDSAENPACHFQSAGKCFEVHAQPAARSGSTRNLTCGSAAAPRTRDLRADRRSRTRSPANAAASTILCRIHVKISVSDTGPGIPAEYHIEVFDDFFRLPNNERQTDGMGLGLAIARRLVNGMGGKIWVESEPGAGCKFSFIVPLQPVPATASKGKTK